MENNNVVHTNDFAAGIRVGIGSSTFHVRGSVSFERLAMIYLLWGVYVIAASWVTVCLLCSPLAQPDDPVAMIALVLILLATTFISIMLPHTDDERLRADNHGTAGVTNSESV